MGEAKIKRLLCHSEKHWKGRSAPTREIKGEPKDSNNRHCYRHPNCGIAELRDEHNFIQSSVAAHLQTRLFICFSIRD
jgi:hypothetical protein